MTSEIHRVRSHFEERNPMLQLSLGALSVAGRFDALLDEFSAASPAPSAPPEALVDLVLGLIAVRNHLLGKLSDATGTTRFDQLDDSALALAGVPFGDSLLR